MTISNKFGSRVQLLEKPNQHGLVLCLCEFRQHDQAEPIYAKRTLWLGDLRIDGEHGDRELALALERLRGKND